MTGNYCPGVRTPGSFEEACVMEEFSERETFILRAFTVVWACTVTGLFTFAASAF